METTSVLSARKSALELQAVGLPSFIGTIRGLIDQAVNAMDGDQTSARRLLNCATDLLQAETDARDANESPTDGGLLQWRIRKVTAYVEARLDRTVQLCELARVANLSSSHFSRAFKESFGLTPKTYIRRMRVARAQHLMIATEEPLSQIALACGFSDQAHFSRVFKRETGSRPYSWRRMRRTASGRRLPAGARETAAGPG